MTRLADLFASSGDPRKRAAAVAAVLEGKDIPAVPRRRVEDEPAPRPKPETNDEEIAHVVIPAQPDPTEYSDPAPVEHTFGAIDPDEVPDYDDEDLDIPPMPEPGLADEPEPVAPTPAPSAPQPAPTPAPAPDPTPSWASYSPVAPVAAVDPDAAGGPALYGDDEDTADDDGGVKFKGASSLSGLMDKPKEIFEKHPTWKRPALFGGIGLVVALVVMFMFGGSPATETPKPPPPPVAQETTDPQADKQVITLMPKAVSAMCGPGSSGPSLVFSKDPKDAWVCVRSNGIDGEIMNIKFAATVIVKSVTIMPGWNYVAPNGTDNWDAHRLVTQILWRLGGQQFIQKINPTRAGSTFTFPGNGVATSEMSLTIQKTERPSATAVQGGEGVNGGQGTDSGGGILPPPPVGGDHAPKDDDVDKTVAIGKITITGTDT